MAENENINKGNKKDFGPSPASLKNQKEYFDRAVDLNDKLRFITKEKQRQTSIDKTSLGLSQKLVNITKNLKGEYSEIKDLRRDLVAAQKLQNQQELVLNNLAKSLTKEDAQRVRLAVSIEQGIQKQQQEHAKLVAEGAKGLVIDEKRKEELKSQIVSQTKSLNTRMKGFDLEQKSFFQQLKQKTLTNEVVQELGKELTTLESIQAEMKDIENSMGLLGGSIKTVNKLFGGQLLNSDKILSNAEARLKLLKEEGKLREGLAGKMQGFNILTQEIGKSILTNLNDPLVYIAIGLDYSTQITNFRNELGLSYSEAANLRAEMTGIAAASGDMAINSKKVTETFMGLNQAFGTASTSLANAFPEVLTQATILQHKMGLSAESTAEFAKMAIVTGQSLEQIKHDTIGAVVAAEKETGARLNIKSVLEATGRVSGQIRAQLAANPKLLAEAVATAKQFGMELEEVASAGKQLLNFESSIASELEAELLTGKQLNLERARLAALTGDYATLAKEINEQVGTFADFSKLNVLQQDALAKSLGMTTDQLSDQLLKKANLQQLAEEARASGNEELAQQLEARSAQEKFNDAVEKLKTMFADLVGGPLAGFIDALGAILKVLNPIFQVVGYIASAFAKVASFDFKNMTVLQGVVGGIVTLLGLMRLRVMAVNRLRKMSLAQEKGITALLATQNLKKRIQAGLTAVLNMFMLKSEGSLVRQNVLQAASNRKGIIGLLRAAGKFIFGMFTAGTQAPGQLKLIMPFIMGAIAGAIAAALLAKFAKGDDVISSGYGKRTLLMPEGAIALNDKDTVIAGTNLSKGDDVISTPAGTIPPPAPPIDYNKMAHAMSNVQVNTSMQYDSFSARNRNNKVFYGNQTGQTKFA